MPRLPDDLRPAIVALAPLHDLLTVGAMSRGWRRVVLRDRRWTPHSPPPARRPGAPPCEERSPCALYAKYLRFLQKFLRDPGDEHRLTALEEWFATAPWSVAGTDDGAWLRRVWPAPPPPPAAARPRRAPRRSPDDEPCSFFDHAAFARGDDGVSGPAPPFPALVLAPRPAPANPFDVYNGAAAPRALRSKDQPECVIVRVAPAEPALACPRGLTAPAAAASTRAVKILHGACKMHCKDTSRRLQDAFHCKDTSRCLQDASHRAAWSGRVPEPLVGILAKVGSRSSTSSPRNIHVAAATSPRITRKISARRRPRSSASRRAARGSTSASRSSPGIFRTSPARRGRPFP